MACDSGRRDETAHPDYIRDHLFLPVHGGLIECKKLHLPISTQYLEWLADEIKAPITFEKLKTSIAQLRTTIPLEMSKLKFAYVPPEKARFLEKMNDDWGNVWDRFKSTKDHAIHGVECYALGLNTACVYHMMMVLEPGLKALAIALNVKYNLETWRRIIHDIEDAIHGMVLAASKTPPGTKAPSARAAARRRDDLTLYSEAAKEFTYFRVAWRNHTAHGRAWYDEHDAARVLEHVRDFMVRLSGRLRERK